MEGVFGSWYLSDEENEENEGSSIVNDPVLYEVKELDSTSEYEEKL